MAEAGKVEQAFWGWPDEVWETAKQAASAVARRWPNWVAPEDVAQDAILYVATHPGEVATRCDSPGLLYQLVFDRMCQKVKRQWLKDRRNVPLEEGGFYG